MEDEVVYHRRGGRPLFFVWGVVFTAVGVVLVVLLPANPVFFSLLVLAVLGSWFGMLRFDIVDARLRPDQRLEFKGWFRTQHTTVSSVRRISGPLDEESHNPEFRIRFDGGSASLDYRQGRELVDAILAANPSIQRVRY